MQRFVATPEEYLKEVPAEQLPIVEHLRTLIREAVPSAKESIGYGMLQYNFPDGQFNLAAQKNSVNLYGTSAKLIAEMAAELKGVDKGKGCLRFKKLEKVPTDALRTLLMRTKKMREENGGQFD